MNIRFIIIYLLTVFLLNGCGGTGVKRTTLRDIDTSTSKEVKRGIYVIPKSDEEIRKAYATYLKYASKDDKSRLSALSRLAELEFELSEQILKNKNNNNNVDAIDKLDDKLYNAKLDRTIELLRTSLIDYPDAKGNDESLYQLAKAYDQKGDSEKSHNTIESLVKKYPKSKYYIESLFRLAEDAFSSKQYADAEDKYTEIIGSKKNNIFYEKSLYKRGWSRFKQEFYFEAVDDFLQVVKLNRFDKYDKLDQTKKDLFNEYFRAIGLSFSYMGGAEQVNEYFREKPNFKYLYYIYSHVSDIYLKAGRNNDAVMTLKYYTQYNKSSDHVPEALLKIISIWKDAGFASKMNNAIVSFYNLYYPDSQYWKNKKVVNQRIYKLVKNKLREYILTVTANYHKKYLLTKNNKDFNNAKTWYENYLKHYSSYSRKDNIHYLYASLLSDNNNIIDAIKHYKIAAYDSNIIINKDAAYETILLASKLSETATNKKIFLSWLNKLIHYSTIFSQQYPNDTKTINIISHVSKVAYKNKMYKETIILSELLPYSSSHQNTANVNIIKAHSYFRLKQYEYAENTYRSVLESSDINQKSKESALNGMALSIYYQGKSASLNNNPTEAINHYIRVSRDAPTSSIAATGMYDAIALAMKNKLWDSAIQYIKEFKRLYPDHKRSLDVSKKLAVAYINSRQDIAAARELEKLSVNDKDKKYKSTALWKAGELYESNKDYASAIRTYEQYAKNYRRPFPQYMESMFRLIKLHTITGDKAKAILWEKNIINADKISPKSLKTERTKLIASTSTLDLAKESYRKFSDIKLVLPLKANLKRKIKAMQKTVNLYARASSYNIAETATEATYSIAEIYNEFSKNLLQSERPKNLNSDELEQYQILLEDRAYPFEEKAIDFYETNLTHVKDDIHDEWVKKSLNQLRLLFPVRYKREAKLDRVINVLH